MPRVTITPRSVTLGTYPSVLPIAANSLDLAEVAADTTNKQQCVWTGRELLIAHNTDASAHTITVTSVPVRGRSGDITAYSIDPAEIIVLPLGTSGYRQTDGKLYFEANHAGVKFAVLKIA